MTDIERATKARQAEVAANLPVRPHPVNCPCQRACTGLRNR